MLDLLVKLMLTRWVNSLPLHTLVKTPEAPCCVVVVDRTMAIHGERRLAGQAGISHKTLFNCGC